MSTSPTSPHALQAAYELALPVAGNTARARAATLIWAAHRALSLDIPRVPAATQTDAALFLDLARTGANPITPSSLTPSDRQSLAAALRASTLTVDDDGRVWHTTPDGVEIDLPAGRITLTRSRDGQAVLQLGGSPQASSWAPSPGSADPGPLLLSPSPTDADGEPTSERSDSGRQLARLTAARRRPPPSPDLSDLSEADEDGADYDLATLPARPPFAVRRPAAGVPAQRPMPTAASAPPVHVYESLSGSRVEPPAGHASDPSATIRGAVALQMAEGPGAAAAAPPGFFIGCGICSFRLQVWHIVLLGVVATICVAGIMAAERWL